MGIALGLQGRFQVWLDKGDGLVPLLTVSLKRLMHYIERGEGGPHVPDGVLLLLPCDVNRTLPEPPGPVVAECPSPRGRVVVVLSEPPAELPVPLEKGVTITFATIYADLNISAVYHINFEYLINVTAHADLVVDCSAARRAAEAGR